MELDPVPNVVRPRDAPCIVALAALLACSENVCGEPGIRRSSATLQAARPSTGATNEPRSPLTAMYRVRRPTTPPASATCRAPGAPNSRLTARPAASNVTRPRFQSTPTSPSTLFARRLYAGVIATEKPSLPSIPMARHRTNTSVSLLDCAPAPVPASDLVANLPPKPILCPTPAARVKLG